MSDPDLGLLPATCPGGCVLAIVGSRILAGRSDAEALIEEAFETHQPVWFVSGGAVGIDSMAESEADRRGFADRKTIHRPIKRTWYYFKKRDVLIANESQCLVSIEGKDATTHGAGWTAQYAQRTGKRVVRHII